jgi:CHAT domain
VAAALVRRELPAVIAMQFEITDRAAISFADWFYTALTHGLPIDAALAEARKGIYGSGNDLEWATPVLFMRVPDGRIFDIREAERAPAAAARRKPAPRRPAPRKAATAKPATAKPATAKPARSILLPQPVPLETLRSGQSTESRTFTMPAWQRLKGCVEKREETLALASSRPAPRRACCCSRTAACSSSTTGSAAPSPYPTTRSTPSRRHRTRR